MKKLLPVLLCAAMLLCLLPLEARAAAAAWDGTVDISWYDPAQTEYTIDTPAKLAGLAALVNGMADPAAKAIVGDRSYLVSKKVDNVMLLGAGGGNVFDTVYTGGVDFAYKTIYLTADLDMGGRKAADGSWTGPNWTPIGGKFPMKPQEASGDCLTLDTRFNGVLDGQGHTIYNLYCDRCAAKGFPYSMAVGVVGFLGGNADYANGGSGEKTEAEFKNGWQPAVRNLVLGSGSIYGRRMVGGIVGRVGETSNGVVIENCGNRADVRNTDSKGVGGICGSAWGAGTIRGCYNTGTISTTYTCPAGGILGTNEGMDVYNCYNAGRIDTNGAQNGRGIGGHDTGSYTVAGCWYLTGCGDDPASNGYYKGTSRKISVSVTAADQKALQSDTVIAALNANGAVFTQDTAGKNGGYPVLWFETQPRTEVCKITQTAAANGTFTVSRTGEAAFGTSVSLTAQPDAGYRLACFTANGAPILGGYYTLTGDTALAAVFQKVKTATITVPEYDAFYLAAARTGYRLTADGMEYVEREALHTGDTVLEGNVITLQTHSYADAIPADGALEYREGYQFTVSGAEKNADGTYTVTGDGAVVGNAQNLIWGGCTAAGGSLPQLGRSGKVSEKATAETCPDYTAREAPQDADLPESFTVTFLANGETVAVMTGRKGDRSVKAPELPQLAGYTAAWPAFTPTGRDMTITAVYRQNLVSGGRVTKSGTYFIPWLASGEITIAGGLDVTLIGLDSGTDRFDNLTLTVGSGTKLTLQDVRITGDRTLLSLAGKNTLTLLGRNELIGCADASGNACPTVVSGGDLTINGTGSLQLQALVNNAAFLGAEKSKISIEDCTLTLLKSDKLGFDGGAFCANGADVTLTNASFSGRTDSDNVAVLSSETVTVTGGTLRVEAEKSVHAVLGCVSLTNCGLYASGHSGNSAKTVSQTAGVDALQTLAQQSGVRTLAASGFADVRAEDACLQDVLTCTAAGIMTGTGQDRFSPEKPMTRAMLVTVLWRMAGSPAAQGNGGFTDLRADWYRQAAVWGAQNGIVSGTSRTTFAPDKAVTKEQACALLARFARTRGVQAAADAAPVYVAECSAWAGSDVQSAYALGIVDSYAACLAAPQASATRAELAHMLSDLLQRV